MENVFSSSDKSETQHKVLVIWDVTFDLLLSTSNYQKLSVESHEIWSWQTASDISSTESTDHTLPLCVKQTMFVFRYFASAYRRVKNAALASPPYCHLSEKSRYAWEHEAGIAFSFRSTLSYKMSQINDQISTTCSEQSNLLAAIKMWY